LFVNGLADNPLKSGKTTLLFDKVFWRFVLSSGISKREGPNKHLRHKQYSYFVYLS
jgi:hypothetical protein